MSNYALPSSQEFEHRIRLVRKAQENILNAIDLVEEALAGMPFERAFDAYLLVRLRITASDDHGYATDDKTLDQLIGELEEGKACAEEEEEGGDSYLKEFDRIQSSN